MKLKFRKKESNEHTAILTDKANKKTFELKDYADNNLVLPKKMRYKNLAIVLKENKNVIFKFIPKNLYRFSVEENTYFNTKSSNYVTDNSLIVTVYLEGIPIGLCHDYIETVREEKEITLIDGKKDNVVYERIKGVKVDSKIIDFLLNRGLADEFTKKTFGISDLMHTILLIILCIMGIITLFKVFL